ncbi:S-adenosyl-L-methionine-dependent methyltransferase [Rhizophagus irregularis]|uniref:S-adenosyl-L-methionine-dependent methyltransferase n=1 Tax=Rhizophagus irregularis TaxID=588596 RepID=A0A2N1NUQ5_9GLOM|nr:S-adenosyl-L-methionine-dependent methyltransferase [Rhizophagus irregularis]
MGTIQSKLNNRSINNKTLTNNNYRELFLENNNLATVDEVIHLGHCVLREGWNGNFSSPINPRLISGAKVLDVGCGSGAWICEMSSDYPSSRYIGIDLLPLFPTTKPFNVQFIHHDFLNGLPFPDSTFDFVHIRFMIFDLTETQWEQFMYSELMRVCKIGGWIEISDPESKLINEGPVTERINYSFRKKLQSRGINPDVTLLHAQHFSSTPNISSPIYHEHREFTISSRLSHDKLAQSLTTYTLESYRCILNSIGHELKLNINNSNVRRNSLMNSIKKNNNSGHIRRSSLTTSSKQGGKDAEIDKLLKTIETEFENYGTRATIHRFYATKTE